MDINLLFKIAAIGILVAVLYQVLVRAGREDQAMMTTLAGLIIVLTMVIKEIIVILKQYRPEFAMYASLIAGILIFALIATKLSGIIEVLKSLSSKTAINNEFLVLLIKITGIAILTEFTVSICKDAGESAIASKVDLGGKVIIMSMSVPIMSSLLEVILNILP